MSRDLLKICQETILHRGLLAPGEKVVAAVSGGADSLCLLHLLWRLREELSLNLFVGHINHLMREEAGKDARYVRDFATKLGLEAEVVEIDIKALAKERKLSLEDAGRQARYKTLETMAQKQGASCIALGHTADDQVETILMNFMRGGGPEGLAGMPICRELSEGCRIVRPIIDFTKAETEAYCQAHGFEPRWDVTNQEFFARRNRIRYKLLPILREEQPALAQVLLRQAEIFQTEEEFMCALTEEALALVQLEKEPSRIVLSIEMLEALPKALARRVIREALRELRQGRQPLGLEQVERVLALATGTTGKEIDLGDEIVAGKEYAKLILVRQPPERETTEQQEENEKCTKLEIPGEIEFGGCKIKVERVARSEIADLSADAGGRIAYIDAAKLSSENPLTIRHPRAGERFLPLGAPGETKLSDFFINLKVPRHERAKTILLCWGEDIVWVVGYRIDDRFKIEANSTEVLRIELL